MCWLPWLQRRPNPQWKSAHQTIASVLLFHGILIFILSSLYLCLAKVEQPTWCSPTMSNRKWNERVDKQITRTNELNCFYLKSKDFSVRRKIKRWKKDGIFNETHFWWCWSTFALHSVSKKSKWRSKVTSNISIVTPTCLIRPRNPLTKTLWFYENVVFNL